MTVDCDWIEKNLEGLFTESLDPETARRARAHIENCAGCAKEVRALEAVDPLVKTYFKRELEIARRRPVVNRQRVFGFSGAAVALVAVLLFVVLRTSQTSPAAPSTQPQLTPAPVAQAPAPIKNNETTGQAEQRAKPVNEPDKPVDRTPEKGTAIAGNAPEFLVSDPAGYSHRLDDYRGHIVVIGVWNAGVTKATANLERLYKTFGANPKFRFLGVTNDRPAKPVNTTFPVVYNQGSKMFGAQPGDFVLLDEGGSVQLRGSLVSDFESLRKLLQRN